MKWTLKMRLAIAFALSILFGELAQAKVPEWAKKNSQSLSGRVLKLVCSGTGPSLNIARRDALDSCRSSARNQLVTNIKVRSLTVQSEKSSGFHEEISENITYVGLNCIPDKEEIEESDGSFTVWMQCRFDLSKVTIAPEESKEPQVEQSNDYEGISNKKELTTLETKALKRVATKIIQDQNTTMSIVSIPRCESLIVRGAKSRVVDCTENPMTIVIDGGDNEILVRSRGYKPKKIILNKEKKSHETIQVTLDLL